MYCLENSLIQEFTNLWNKYCLFFYLQTINQSPQKKSQTKFVWRWPRRQMLPGPLCRSWPLTLGWECFWRGTESCPLSSTTWAANGNLIASNLYPWFTSVPKPYFSFSKSFAFELLWTLKLMRISFLWKVLSSLGL